jgi:protein-disulfide isomerase
VGEVQDHLQLKNGRPTAPFRAAFGLLLLCGILLGWIAFSVHQLGKRQIELTDRVQAVQNQVTDLRRRVMNVPIGQPSALPKPIPDAPIALSTQHQKGSPSARIVIIEFADFQCPFCGRFSREVLPSIDRNYIATGKVRLAFHHLPLRIHPRAVMAAQASECAARQQKFWQMHDLLFRDGKELEDAHLMAKATTVGLDVPAFLTCLNGAPIDKVRVEEETARELGLTSTPTFMIGLADPGGRSVKVLRRISGVSTVQAFSATLDELLRSQK